LAQIAHTRGRGSQILSFDRHDSPFQTNCCGARVPGWGHRYSDSREEAETMRTVLFVDDDQEEFNFLTRGISKERGNFEMHYVASGEEALERLALENFDAIIASTRTVGMDGATLLQTVCEKHPAIVRILLASQQEMECLWRTNFS
jgi:CheY-like chemotaxis protein